MTNIMTVSKTAILKNLNEMELPADIRAAYDRTFSLAQDNLTEDDVERLVEETIERNWDPDGGINAYIPAKNLINGKATEPTVNANALRIALDEQLPDDSYNVRGKFMKAVTEISEKCPTLSRTQIEKAFVIASGNAFPPSQQAMRDACNEDIGVLRDTIKKIIPSAKLV